MSDEFPQIFPPRFSSAIPLRAGRAHNLLHHSFHRVAWLILECARRTSTFLSCAFREQEDDQAARLFLFYEERFRVFSRGGGDAQEDQAFLSATWHGRGDAVVGLVKLSWMARTEGDTP